MVRSLDLTSGTISKPPNNSGRRAFLSGTTSSASCTAHQQQIASMELSPHANVLATCSWDSTCMLWQIHETPVVAATALTGESGSSEPAMTALRLVLTHILPVHNLGASCSRFVSDGQQVLTAGECTIKLWDLVEPPLEEAPSQLEVERAAWDAAIPFSLSVHTSLRLLAFDEPLAVLLPNHSWTYQRHARPNGETELKLLVPEQSASPSSLHSASCQRDHHVPQHEPDVTTTKRTPRGSGSATTTKCFREADPRDPLEPVGLLSGPPDSMQLRQQQGPTSTEHEPSRRGDTRTSISPSADAQGDSDRNKSEGSTSGEDASGETSPRPSLGMLSADDTTFLEQYYRDLKSFDFAELLNPTVPLRAAVDSSQTGAVDTSNQHHDTIAAPRSLFTFAVEPSGEGHNATITSTTTKAVINATKELVWTPLLPDANGALVTTFSERNAHGIFSAHTSRITSCAVATDLGVLVTVALDKALKIWSLASAQVLETVVEAHSAPITCCTLTTRQTRQNPTRGGMLVATGAKDNVVKVWRRNCVDEQPTECIYSFTGHYDALTCCAFDSTGEFLVSGGDDTNVIVWRVVPASPDQPKLLAVVTVDSFAIIVSWEVPLANGSPLLYYVVRVTQTSSLVAGGLDSVAIPDVVVPAKYTSQTVEGLQPGVQYTLEIAAVNAVRNARLQCFVFALHCLLLAAASSSLAARRPLCHRSG